MKFVKISVGLLAVIGVLLAGWAFFVEPNRLVVNNYNLSVRKWSPKLENFKIVAISDVHGGSNFIDEAKIRRVVDMANAQNPDIIVLLGDYVSQQRSDRSKLKMPLETIAASLGGLKAAYGVYAVIGNHDNWYSGKAVRQALENDGYRVLENEAVSIEKNGAKLRLLGMEDILQETIWDKSKEKALNALNRLESKEGKIVVLTHNPDSVAYLSEITGISTETTLFLAGHTHGGQVRLPLIGTPIVPSAYGGKFAAGIIREGNVDMFVTTGIGTSILPVRFEVAPEIAVLTINPAE